VRAAYLVLFAAVACAQQPPDDLLLKAMRDELQRGKALRLPGVDSPYFIEYALDEIDSFSVSATQGAIIQSNDNHTRMPRVQVRVGSPAFDNTNYVFTDFLSPRATGRVVLDNDPTVIRRHFWLATDRGYKGAVESVSRKRSALRNVTQQEKLNDFAKADPVQLYRPSTKPAHNRDQWTRLTRNLAAIFGSFPKVTHSQVDFDSSFATTYYVNSEGTEFRYPDDLFYLRVRASAQAPDGMPVRDASMFIARSPDKLPSEADLRRGVTEIAEHVTALAQAPVGEDYSGPVLVEGVAATQMFAQLLGSNLGLARRPVNEPGRQIPFAQSELEGRMGSRILPEWMDVVDDPAQTAWRGQELQGHYPVDMEGVVPHPVTVIEKGTVKSFLLSRLPVRGYEGSNGRARLPGAFGSNAAVFSNLFIRAKDTMTQEALRKRLLELITQRGKPYGIIVRKLDFPTSGSLAEVQRLTASSGQRGGSLRPTSVPILVYRIYPDGRQELVRGLRFRSVNVRTLRDIIAASDTEHIFHFLGNGSPLPMMGGGGYIAGHSVVAPSVLFEDLELEKREDDWPKLPVVPPPSLTSQARTLRP